MAQALALIAVPRQHGESVHRFDLALWARLHSLRLEGPHADVPLAARLLKETRWTPDFTARVVREYRRFLYLAATEAEPVTPSHVVDQAWHQHILHTRHYWGELCGEVLGTRLHHDPGDGSRQDEERHARQYERTLAAYQATFGEPAPADIWPRAAPAPAQAGRRKVASLAPLKAAALAGAFLLASLGVAWSRGSSNSSDTGWVGPLLLLGLVAFLIGRAASPASGGKKDEKKDSGGGAGCGGSSDGGASGGGCGGGCGGG